MADEDLRDQNEKDTVPLKKDTLTPDQIKIWISRCRTANSFHRRQLCGKYNTAKDRYNGDMSKQERKKNRLFHQDINFLYKDIEDFNSSIYFKNPMVDFTSRDTEDTGKVQNIENLEQLVNDDIKDDLTLKPTMRAALVDEGLAGIAGVYLDYDYRTQNAVDEQGNPIPLDVGGYQQEEIEQKVKLCKLRPENIIRPPYQTLFDYQDGPYLGYVDIVSIECLKSDPTLDQDVVKKVKGRHYDELLDIDKEDLKNSGEKNSDDLLYAKIYCVFLKGDDKRPLKRLVLADEQGLDQALAYGDYDKGHGVDDRGYPVHILALNDACEGFIPPSEAWILEPILMLMDYLWQKQVAHLRASKTRTFVKAGKDGLKKTDIVKWVKNEDLEIFAINNLAPGVDIRALVSQITDQELSGDHQAMYEMAKRIFDQLSRQPSFSQAAVLEKKKTATESAAIQQEDKSTSAYKIDKFKDFQKAIFYDWGKLRQRNLVGMKSITIENPQSGMKEPRQIGIDQIQGGFNVDIDVNTFVQPNKELKRRIIKDAMADSVLFQPLLKEQGLTLNGKRLTSEYFQNIEIRNPDELIMPAPVRRIDQQVTEFVMKKVPFNPDELGGDIQTELNRLMQIFSDDQMMQIYEGMSPGVSLPDGPLAEFARGLEMMIKQKKTGQASGGKSPSDMRSEAGMMAESVTP